jgi:long-chain acyl-CoA synthetase
MGEDVKEEALENRFNEILPNNISSLIYTSGTTGNPKGVIITHDNWDFECQQLLTVANFEPNDKSISWLPGAHVFGQAVDCHFTARLAMHSYIVDSPLNTVDYAKEIQPHLFISVPRVYEKVYSNFKSAVDSKAILKIGLKIPVLSGVLKNKLKSAAGFSNVTYAISGAAPINPEILEFFQMLGIPLFEGYGLTESTAGASLNYNFNNKIGSVGKKFPDTDIKINNDGEILLKGRHIMSGYYNNQKATDEVLIDGWFHTGDVGKLDEEGYLFITGRKKEIYVSSAGKNIAPLVIEETMKSIPIISQCFLVGDNRNYCTALFTLDVGAILRDKLEMEATVIPKDPVLQIKALKERGFTLLDFTGSDEIEYELQMEVDKLNKKFSNPEQLKKFSILPRDFTIDDGELTPTLKIRRKQITENWSEIIDSMYK